MKNILFLFALSIIISSVSCSQEKYGSELSIEEKTAISEIKTNPEEYLGKTVLVEGKIAAVCQNMGCWMEIVDEEGEKIRVKVKDGEIIFPKDGAGKTALVEGEVYKIEMDEEEAREFYVHMSEQTNQELDSSRITVSVII